MIKRTGNKFDLVNVQDILLGILQMLSICFSQCISTTWFVNRDYWASCQGSDLGLERAQ